MGVYPDVGLKEARERWEVARKQVADGINPAEHRKSQKAEIVTNVEEFWKSFKRIS